MTYTQVLVEDTERGLLYCGQAVPSDAVLKKTYYPPHL